MRVIKYLLASVATVVIVVALAAAVLFSADYKLLREQLEARGTDAFGRPVHLEGAIRLRPSWNPDLVFEDVVVDNPDWASRPHFLTTNKLRVKVALLPLLRGELDVLDIVLDGVDVLLETRPDGVNNFTFGDQDSPSVLPDIDQFTIREFLIANRYADQNLRRIAITEAKIVNIAGQRVTIDGTAQYRKMPLRFSFLGGTPAEFVKPTKPWPVQVHVNLADARFLLEGQVAKPLTWEGGSYQLAIKGEKVQTLARAFDLDLPSAGPYEFSSQLRAEAKRYRLTEISSSIQGIENTPDLKVFDGAGSVSADDTLKLMLSGEYGDVPFALDLEGGAYTELLAPDVPWPLKLSARVAEMNLSAQGVITEIPESGPAVDAAIAIKGDLGNHIWPLFGFKSPVSGPMELSAQVTGAHASFTATSIAGLIDDPNTVGTVKLSQGAIAFGAGEPTKLSVTGTIDGEAFTTTLEGGAIDELVAGNTPWPVRIGAHAGGATFAADGTFDGFDARPLFNAQVELKGKNFASFNPLFNVNFPSIGPYEISAQVRNSADGVLTLADLSSRIGDSDLSGEVRFKYAQPDPKTSWKLVSKNLHLDQLFLARGGRASAGNAFDQPLNLNWLPGIADEASLKIKNVYGLGVPIRNASIEETLTADGELTVDPIRMTVAGSVIQVSFHSVAKNGVNLVTLDARSYGIDVGKIFKILKLGDTIEGRAEKLLISFKSRGDTVRSWLKNTRGTVTIKQADLSVYNPLKDQTLPLQADRVEVFAKPRSPLKLSVDGRVRSVPVNLNAEIGTLANTIIAHEPWPLKVSLQSANVALEANGKVTHPTKGRGFDVDFELKGEELREGFPLLGYVVPLAGSYRVKGHLEDDPGRYHFTNLQSRIGNSDLEGSITVNTQGRRTHVIAKFAANQLDLNDVVLTDVDTKPETVDTRVIPDYTIPHEVLQAFDLDLDGYAERVVVGTSTFGDLSFKVNLKDGRFVLSPFKVTGVTGAKVKAKYYFDTSVDPPTSSVQIDADDVNVGLLLKSADVTDLVEGRADLDVYLAGPGGSRRQFLGGATGQINLVGGKGKFASRKLDRWAADLTTTMLSSAWERQDVTDINCMVARINVDKGIAKSDEIIVDTKRITIAGSGALDLSTEEIDLVLAPAPKKPSLVSLANPVRVKGPLSSPTVTQKKFGKKGRRIMGLAVGALSGFFAPAIPVAVLLTFSDLGTMDDNPCVAAIDKASSEAKQEQHKRDESTPESSRSTDSYIIDETID